MQNKILEIIIDYFQAVNYRSTDVRLKQPKLRSRAVKPSAADTAVNAKVIIIVI